MACFLIDVCTRNFIFIKIESYQRFCIEINIIARQLSASLVCGKVTVNFLVRVSTANMSVNTYHILATRQFASSDWFVGGLINLAIIRCIIKNAKTSVFVYELVLCILSSIIRLHIKIIIHSSSQ